MKALPFPCIRPADDRLNDALGSMGAILKDGNGIRDGIADGRLLKDPGAAYYVYEHADETSTKTAVLAICTASDVAKTVASAGSTPHTSSAVATAADIQDLRVQPRATSLAYPDQPVMAVIIDAAKQGTPLYELSDATGRSSARTPSMRSTPCSNRFPASHPQATTNRLMKPHKQRRTIPHKQKKTAPSPGRNRLPTYSRRYGLPAA